MTRPSLPTPINDLLALYFDNQATPEVCQAIEDWLAQDPANIKVLAEFGYIERLMYSVQKTQDASAIFAVLAEMEEAAEGQVVELKLESEAPPHTHKQEDAEPITARQVASVVGFVLRQALTGKPAILAYAASVALIAAVLLIPWNTPPADPQTAQQTPPVTTPTQPTGPVVATLTAAHDAHWADPAPAVGQALYPGQSLTLTHGQAQLTTSRGAQVTLIGPCTIALTDSDNALNLSAGRLVGFVPANARGFVVQTPSARLVDIGTEFAVEFDNRTRQTRIQVYQGEVTAAPLKADGQPEPPRSITTGQARTVDRAGVHPVAFNPAWIDPGLRLSRLRPIVTGGMAKWSATVPGDLRQGAQVLNGLQVYLEAHGMLLDQPVRVDLVGQRNAWPTSPAFLEPLPVAQGERVDMYLLHMDQTGLDKSSPVYTLDFGRPILGVIARQVTLVETDRLADPDGHRRYIDAAGELRAVESQDTVRIGDDGQSIQVQLDVDHKIDQIRVLVRAAEEPSNVNRP